MQTVLTTMAETISGTPHSFGFIRHKTGLGLSDDQFIELIRRNSDRFEVVRFKTIDAEGRRIRPGRPGVRMIV